MVRRTGIMTGASPLATIDGDRRVRAPSAEVAPPRLASVEQAPSRMRYAMAIGAIALATALGLALFPYVTLPDVAMLYVSAIGFASLSGRGPSLAAAALAVAAFNFCFVPPRFTFAVAEPHHLLTFAVMFGAGLAISTLTVRLREQERDAVVRERNTATLLAFTREIAAAITPGDVAAVTVRHLEDAFPVAAAVAIPDPDEPGALTSAAGLMPLARQEQAVTRWAFDHGEAAGLGTRTLPGARVLAVPLIAGDTTVGVIAVQARQDPRRLGGAALPMLEAFAHQASLALARVRFAQEARDAALRARTEELRSSLLSAVSHDLRTPLAVITGAATTLRDERERLAPAIRDELVATIVDDAQRLERVLANLLQLTRVESGLAPAREWIPVEELVGAALTRLEDALGDRAVELDIPADLAVAVDPVLFEHVLINLIDNALKHAAPPIELRARRRDDVVVLEVRDHGPGVPAQLGQRLFDKFVRASSAPGAGLGLAVVRSIVAAHGGTITVEAPAGGGACFHIELPADHPTARRPPVPEATASTAPEGVK